MHPKHLPKRERETWTLCALARPSLSILPKMSCDLQDTMVCRKPDFCQ